MFRIAWCTTKNPIGQVMEKHFKTYANCLCFLKSNIIPKDTAGYTIYKDVEGEIPETLLDYQVKQ